jgi:glycerophosphoryl diester phosphodiesterase
MEWLTQYPIAHRGLHNGTEAPENSLRAFERAASKAIPIELDVHLTADGRLAVFHDDTLKRMTSIEGSVEGHQMHFLQGLRLLDSDQMIPTLEDVLDLVAGKVPVLIEIKTRARHTAPIGRAVLDCISRFDAIEVAVQSFNPLCIRWFRQNAPSVIRGLLAGGFSDDSLPFHTKFSLRNYLLSPAARPNFLAHEVQDLPTAITRLARRVGVPVIAWTVRSISEQAHARKYADNFIFEGEGNPYDTC